MAKFEKNHARYKGVLTPMRAAEVVSNNSLRSPIKTQQIVSVSFFDLESSSKVFTTGYCVSNGSEKVRLIGYVGSEDDRVWQYNGSIQDIEFNGMANLETRAKVYSREHPAYSSIYRELGSTPLKRKI